VRMGEAGRRHASDDYAVDRLVADHDRLYRTLLRERPKTA